MNWDQLFSVAGNLAMVGWVILLFAPRRWPTLNAVPAYAIPTILSVGYAVLVAVYFVRPGGSFDSLDGVGQLLSSEPTLLAGWVHYLAFDLFIGAWIARRCDALGIYRLVQVPILIATFMFGPVGLFLYLVTARAWTAISDPTPVEA